MKYHRLKKEFKIITDKIITENKSLPEWEEIESDDMFQTDIYVGGFDGTEMEFCFSVFEEDGNEYWFQISIDDILKYSKKELFDVALTNPDC